MINEKGDEVKTNGGSVERKRCCVKTEWEGKHEMRAMTAVCMAAEHQHTNVLKLLEQGLPDFFFHQYSLK